MKNNSKLGGFNCIIIGLISILYVLMVNKLAQVLSLTYENPDDQVGTYVMIIYFISIMSMAIAYIYFNDKKNSEHETANWIMKWSLNIGGVILLIYTIINYWDFLTDHSKLLVIVLSIIFIIYFLYKHYDQ
jgi:presenilin-like A22 family membrane protease